MKSKRIITAFIVFVFLAVATVGFFSVFTIKRVDASFAVSDYGKPSSEDLCKELNSIKGKSLLFLKEEQVKSVIDKYPYFETLSVSKSYPNVVTVSLKERRETYLVNDGDNYYVLSDSGFILNKNARFEENLITFTGVMLSNPEVGKKAVCNVVERTELLDIVYGMSEMLDSTDSVKSVEIISMNEHLKEGWRVVFNMKTGVKIVIYDAFVDGLDKMQCALSLYEGLNDYQKCYNYVIADKRDDGKIVVEYTSEMENN